MLCTPGAAFSGLVRALNLSPRGCSGRQLSINLHVGARKQPCHYGHAGHACSGQSALERALHLLHSFKLTGLRLTQLENSATQDRPAGLFRP